MRLVGRGVNADLRPDQVPDGFAKDTVNLRLASVSGNAGSLESIGGEQVRFTPQPDEAGLDDDYVCIGAFRARNDDVSFHAPLVDTMPFRIKINGVTMVRSTLVPYRWDRPLQCAVPNRDQGAILFPVDGNAPPLFWDIEAIKTAFLNGEQTYLDDFNPQIVSVTPPGPTEWPEHIGNPDIGVGALPGQYVFFLRNYEADGTRSNLSPPTPHISVAQVQAPVYWPGGSPPNFQYPGGQTTGGQTVVDQQTPTPYGIHLRWLADNHANHAGVEVVALKFNDGQGLNGPGETEVVARIDMSPGMFDFIDFVYPRDSNFSEIIPTDEAQQQLVNFTAPKAVEYVDNKVIYGNITLKEEVVEVEFADVNGSKTFPFTQRVFTIYGGQFYNDGFSEPRNATYCKSARHDERYGVGMQFYDGNGSRTHVCVVQDNVQLPERARRKTGQSLRYSSDPIHRTNTECQGGDPVSPTFDAIVQGSIAKVDDSYTNVISGSNYNPWAPKGPADPNFVRYRQKPVGERLIASLQSMPDTGNVFAPQVHSLGVGINGPVNVDGAVPGWEVMSVMRTRGADRAIASGMAVYQKNEDNASFNDRKHSNRVIAWFPDMESGVVSASIREDITNNPQNYQLKFTPYGFYQEQYAGRLVGGTSAGMDMVLYMDMQNDTGTGTMTSVNVGEPPGQIGIQPGASAPPSRTNNVGYQAWRRRTNDVPDGSAGDYLFFMDPANQDQGAAFLGIQDFSRVQEGRGSVYHITTTQGLYRTNDFAGGSNFSTDATRRFHGPVWVVDILRKDAVVPTLNIQQYLHTGTHVAKARTIGLFTPNGQGYMDAELFHARLYDAVPRAGDTPYRRYAYIQAQGQSEQRWMFAGSDLGGATIQDVFDAINATGFWTDPDGHRIYGVYSWVSNDELQFRRYYLRFGEYSQIPPPPVGARIVVKYDSREPILSLGFDATIAPWTWAAIDRRYNYMDGNSGVNTCVNWPIALPYRRNYRASQYVLPRDATGMNLNQSSEVTLDMGSAQWVRQMAVMGHLVTRTPGHMNTGGGDTVRHSFPRTHYIMRPSAYWADVHTSGAAAGFHSQYDQDYPGEQPWWDYGGIRCQNMTLSPYNLDYSRPPLVSGLGVPLSGPRPRRRLPTGLLASLPYNPLSQDSPGLRTFTWDNLFIADEGEGEVKFIAALDQGGMQRIWVWTEHGYFNVPYNAQMLTDGEGNVIGTQSVGVFWPRRENWVARGDHGMPGEFWRLATKANALVGKDRTDTVFWHDRTSSYMLVGGRAVDVLENGFRSVLGAILPGTVADTEGRYNALYNRKNNEWWTSIRATDGDGPHRTLVFVFNAATQTWAGFFTYDHEQYIADENGIRGFTGLSAWMVDQGLVMKDGNPVTHRVTVPFFQDHRLYKEGMRWRVVGDMPPSYLANPDHTPYAPSRVELFDADLNLLSMMDASTGPLWRKAYDGYEGWINRVLTSQNPSRPLPQAQGFFLRVHYDTLGKKVVSSVGMQLKHIK